MLEKGFEKRAAMRHPRNTLINQVATSFRSMKEEIVFGVAERARASKTETSEAEEKYSSIETMLRKAPKDNIIHRLDVLITPQGSHPFQVPIKCPEIQNSSIDLDAVILYTNLTRQQIEASPFALVAATHSAMKPHLEQYNLRAVLKDRCITVFYKNISVDLLPAIPFNPSDPYNNRILIPEKVSGHTYRLVSSDPFTLLERFKQRAELEFQESFVKMALDEGTISSDDFPERLEYLGVMRYVIVLIKRARDNFFPDVMLGRKFVKSILLTTFLSENYHGQKELLLALDSLSSKLYLWAESSSSETIRLPNPVDPTEDFAKYLREDPEKLNMFKAFAYHLRSKVQELISNQSITSYEQSLIDLFGKDIVKSEVEKVQASHSKLQASDGHRINSLGHLGVAGAFAVPKTRFYGDD